MIDIYNTVILDNDKKKLERIGIAWKSFVNFLETEIINDALLGCCIETNTRSAKLLPDIIFFLIKRWITAGELGFFKGN